MDETGSYAFGPKCIDPNGTKKLMHHHQETNVYYCWYYITIYSCFEAELFNYRIAGFFKKENFHESIVIHENFTLKIFYTK